MKINKLLIFFIASVFSLSSCKANQENELNMLKMVNKQFNEVLESFINEEAKYGDIKKSIIIIKLENSNDIKELRIGALYEESLSSYLTNKKDKPLGFFDYKNLTVIVFGENEKTLFEKTNTKKIFSALEIKTEQEVKKGEVPPPPVIYEPVVWIYVYEKGKFHLKDKGRFTLLS